MLFGKLAVARGGGVLLAGAAAAVELWLLVEE